MSDARTLGRNTASKYGALAIDTIVGLLLLPYNLSHLGPAEYGLWVLAASIACHVSLLDLGFGKGLVRFAAECRARGEDRRLDEFVSTLFLAFAAAGAIAFAAMAGIALLFDRLFAVDPHQAETGRIVLLLVGGRLALVLPLSVFGAVVNGAQRYMLNNVVGGVTAIVVAAVNVWVIRRGGGVVEVVAATTLVHVASYAAYVVNGYRVQPGLQVSPRLASRARLKEVGAFSTYVLVLDWANRVTHTLDTLVIGGMLGTRAVAAFAPAARVAQIMREVTGQFHGVLLPAVVDLAARGQQPRFKWLLVEGTRLSAALAVALAIGLIGLAAPLLAAWVGPAMAGSAPVLQTLAVANLARVTQATGATILVGTGGHRELAAIQAGTAAVSVALWLTLAGPLGLFGVALGTATAACAGALVVIPLACRRLELPIGRFVRKAIWPVAWPAGPAAAALWTLRSLTEPATLAAVVTTGGLAAALYLSLLYGVALTVGERATLRGRLRSVVSRAAPVEPARRQARAAIVER